VRQLPVALAVLAFGLVGCISTRQSLTPEASRVAYTDDPKVEPSCDLVEELTVGRDYFVTDERQPAVSNDDVVVRFRRLAAKKGGNYVVILENEPPNNQCTGYNGLGRIYRCSDSVLASLPKSSGGSQTAASQ
jgi:hypothetical protein